MLSATGSGNNHGIAIINRLFRKVGEFLRRAVRRNHFGVMGNAELLQNFDSGLHGCPIAFGAHNDGDFVISGLSIAHSLLSRRSNIRLPKIAAWLMRVNIEYWRTAKVSAVAHHRGNAFHRVLLSEKRRASYHTEIANHISPTAV